MPPRVLASGPKPCGGNKSYQFRERFDLATNETDVIESQVIELTAKPKNLLIAIIYRPPYGKVEELKSV